MHWWHRLPAEHGYQRLCGVGNVRLGILFAPALAAQCPARSLPRRLIIIRFEHLPYGTLGCSYAMLWNLRKADITMVKSILLPAAASMSTVPGAALLRYPPAAKRRLRHICCSVLSPTSAGTAGVSLPVARLSSSPSPAAAKRQEDVMEHTSSEGCLRCCSCWSSSSLLAVNPGAGSRRAGEEHAKPDSTNRSSRDHRSSLTIHRMFGLVGPPETFRCGKPSGHPWAILPQLERCIHHGVGQGADHGIRDCLREMAGSE